MIEEAIMRPSPARLLIVTAALAAAVVGAAAPAEAHHPAVTQPFAADSGDDCRYGTTQGTLAWAATHPPEPASVTVAGTVSDAPPPASPGCRDDQMFTVASFRAFTGDLLVDEETRRVDNDTLGFGFRLTASLPVSHIERIDVQVCRMPLIHATRTAYCGKPKPHFPIPNVDGATD
jgi:hypothetical protein